MRVWGGGTQDGTLHMMHWFGFPREIYENDSNANPIYSGVNLNASATTTDSDWVILKQQYNATTGAILQAQMLEGQWSNHTNLGWAFSA